VKREIQACAKSDPRVSVLTRIPGVGSFIALLVIAEVGDVARFPSGRHLASFAGLTPRVRKCRFVVVAPRLMTVSAGTGRVPWSAPSTALASPDRSVFVSSRSSPCRLDATTSECIDPAPAAADVEELQSADAHR
jgi:hypothetical protein